MAFPLTSTRKRIAAGSQAKTLLKNVIRHTDAHNRLLEEADMWNMHTKMKQGRSSDDLEGNGRSAGSHRKWSDRGSMMTMNHRDKSDIKKSFLYDDRETLRDSSGKGRRGARRAHMDDDNDGDGGNVDRRDESTFWMRQMFKAEAVDQDRWGHAGYKDLYPQDFDSERSGNDSNTEDDSSDSSSSSSRSSEVKKKKRSKNHKKKKTLSKESHRKIKRRKKERRRKRDLKRKKKSKKDESESESEESCNEGKKRKSNRESYEKKKDKEKDSSHDKRKKKKKRKLSDSEDSNSSDDHKRKRRKK